MNSVIETAIAALIGLVVTGLGAGIVALVRMLSRISRDVSALGPSMRAIYEMQPYMLKATRYQNAALKELGANGSTEKSNECLDAAEACLDRQLVEHVGGCA